MKRRYEMKKRKEHEKGKGKREKELNRKDFLSETFGS